MADPTAGLFPPDVVVAWLDPRRTGPVPDAPDSIVNAFRGVRRQHFLLGRACANSALRSLGYRSDPLPILPDGAPAWPAGAAGAVTHCPTLVAAALAPAERYPGLGIDAEQAGRKAARAIERIVCTASETRGLSSLPAGTDWRLLFFSAKESIYKALPARCRGVVGFKDVEVVFDVDDATYRARPTGMLGGCETVLERIEGRFRVTDDVILTSAFIRAA